MSLNGCVNDATDMCSLFVRLDYNATILTEPTKAQAMDAIRQNLSSLSWGDRFVLTWSGHGSRVPDRDGDEADGWDEVLIPKDYRTAQITDDELAAVFDTAKTGVRRIIFSDTCHSGTVNRAFGGTTMPHGKPRFLPPSEFMSAKDIKVALRLEERTVPTNKSRVGALLISGCNDPEFSYDAWFQDHVGRLRANGAFTRAALDTFREGQTLNGWYRAIRKKLPSSSYPQTPQMQAGPYQRYWHI
jgi:hypothetical protein